MYKLYIIHYIKETRYKIENNRWNKNNHLKIFEDKCKNDSAFEESFTNIKPNIKNIIPLSHSNAHKNFNSIEFSSVDSIWEAGKEVQWRSKELKNTKSLYQNMAIFYDYKSGGVIFLP